MRRIGHGFQGSGNRVPGIGLSVEQEKWEDPVQNPSACGNSPFALCACAQPSWGCQNVLGYDPRDVGSCNRVGSKRSCRKRARYAPIAISAHLKIRYAVSGAPAG